jgi:tetratricopeptide (TPR) repeat protein
MTPDEKKQAHNQLVTLFQHACEPEQYKVAYDEAKKFLAENPDDSNAHFMFGYSAYWVSYDQKSLLIEAEQAFQKCLALGPSEWDKQMTAYHLGFLYSRQGLYQKTLDTISERNPNFFNSINQFWRVAKLDEVELACHYYLRPENLSLKAAEELEKQYARFKEVCDAPLLIEIGDCLSHLLKQTSQTNSQLEQICRVITRIISHLEQSDCLRKRDGLFFQRL